MSTLEYFQGKSAIITGAGRGIGRAIAVKLNDLGTTVYAISKNPDNLASLKSECPEIQTIAVDVGDWTATRTALDKLPVIELLVNNAAVCTAGTFEDTTPENLDLMFNINLKSVFNVSQVFVKKLKSEGRKGSIVNISSCTGVQATPMLAAYSTLKAALDHLTRNMAVELAPFNIRVNAVNPGPVATDMLASIAEQAKNIENYSLADTFGRIPMPNKVVDVEDVVNTTLFLLSDAAVSMIGNITLVDGGFAIA